MYTDLVSKDKVSAQIPSANSSSASANQFLAGNAYMSLDGPWDLINARAQAKFKVGIAPMPAGASGSKTWSDGSGFGVTSDCKNPDEAFKAVSVMTGADAENYLGNLGRAYPALISTQNSWYKGNKTEDVKPVMDFALTNSVPYTTTADLAAGGDHVRQAGGGHLQRPGIRRRSAQPDPGPGRFVTRRTTGDAGRRSRHPASPQEGGRPWQCFRSTSPTPPTARPPRPRRRRRRGDGRAATGFLAPSMLGLLAFTAFPIVASLILGFFDWPVIGDHTFTGLKNYQTLSTARSSGRRSSTRCVFVVLYVPLNIVISLGLAVWISPKIRLRGLYRTIFFIPAVTPVVANAAIFSLILSPNGLVDSLMQTWFGVQAPNFLGSKTWAMPAVVLLSIWQGFGYNMLVFSAALDAVPTSLTEAAAIDGASAGRAVLPDRAAADHTGHLLRRRADPDLIVPGLHPGVRPHRRRPRQRHHHDGGLPVRAGLPVLQARGSPRPIAWVLFLIILISRSSSSSGRSGGCNYDQ